MLRRSFPARGLFSFVPGSSRLRTCAALARGDFQRGRPTSDDASAAPLMMASAAMPLRFDAARSFTRFSRPALATNKAGGSASSALRDANPYLTDPAFRAKQDAESKAAQDEQAKQTAEEASREAAAAAGSADGAGGTYESISPEARSISNWLFVCAGMIFTIVVVGGVTRLTESGLSIVEWRPVTGMVPPLTQQQWEAEFAKYQKYPEYALNPNMDLAHFKFIFFWEWAHRVLARSVGIVFGVPMVYFMSRGYLRRKPLLNVALLGLFCLGGAQGAVGWYMVKSGLDPKLVEQRRKATVSAYRLAIHLSLALVLYASVTRLALALRVTPKMWHEALGIPPIMSGASTRASHTAATLEAAKEWWDVRLLARVLLASLAGTIVSGAFVAGLDAGLFFNDEFPLMLGGIFPPAAEVFKLHYAGAKSSSNGDKKGAADKNKDPQAAVSAAASSGSAEEAEERVAFWRYFCENPVAAQLGHRLLAGLTLWMVVGINLMMRYKKWRAVKNTTLPRPVVSAVRGVTHATVFQCILGMLTIIFSVPIPVAALHQANAVITLTMVLRLLTVLSTRGAVRL